jgi:ectoine hydroxylase-related dioxygenase (phytanoyl-CoA dioxygenase family)
MNPAEAIKSYGVTEFHQLESDQERIVEEVRIIGYSVIENVLNDEELKKTREKLDAVLVKQEEGFGKDKLKSINELNLARCPLAYDEYFIDIAANKMIIDIIKKLIGNYVLLHLQNGIINTPNEEHHQSSWHRDLPYQEYTTSRPIGINALYCIDNFSGASGGTLLLPFSHRLEKLPSINYLGKHELQLEAKAGSVVLFDSMVYHKAGYNSSNNVRRAINHVYTTGIFKQQLNLPAMLNKKYATDPQLKVLLGFESVVPDSDAEWRTKKLNRKTQ